MGTKERIFEKMAERGLEQQEFAQLLGVGKKTVSAWNTDRAKSYNKFLPRIAEVLQTSVEYLLTGQEPEPQKVQMVSGLQLTPEEIDLVRAYRRADEQARRIVSVALEPFVLGELASDMQVG